MVLFTKFVVVWSTKFVVVWSTKFVVVWSTKFVVVWSTKFVVVWSTKFVVVLSKSFVYQQMNFISVLENIKIYIKTYLNCSYMFRSTTIIRERTYEPS